MTGTAHERASRTLAEIKDLMPRFVTLIAELDTRISSVQNGGDVSDLDYTSAFWVAVAYRNALIRLRLILEQNFFYLETLNVLATTRYVFETLVWLRMLAKDRTYGAVFYGQAIDKQMQHLKALKKKFEGEIALFEELAKEETRLHQDAMTKLLDNGKTVTAKTVAAAGAGIVDEIDRKARRAFSLYGDQAKRNGYSYQAHLIREKDLPQLEKQIENVLAEQKAFNLKCPPSARKKLKTWWKWRENATRVEMSDQYDFIYSYTSRLLHATPASIFTDEKNLKPQEIVSFLEYIYVSMLDALDLGEEAARF